MHLAALDILRQARTLYTQKQLAEILEVNESTFRRWEVREDVPPYRVDAIRQRILPLITAPANDGHTFTFIDLFAGIGGIRLGFEAQGGHCVFTSEWNTYAQKTYLANFPHQPGHLLVGDITKIDAADVPDHDVLLAGFPCQPFSIAGVSKKNALGRPHGFECTTQGTLFYDVARIIAEKRPKAFLLENVKNLVSHDKGQTFKKIMEVLREELGYEVHYKVIDGQRFVPQHRERVLIVGFREPCGFSWDGLCLPEAAPKLSAILHPQDGSEAAESPYTEGDEAIVHPKYTLTAKLWAYLQGYAEKHRAAGNGFGFGLVDADSVARTLSARYYKDGSEILVSQGKRKRPRRLTPRECARLMGFPDSFVIPVSDTQSYQLFAQAAVVPVVAAVAKCVVSKMAVKEAAVSDALMISPNALSQKGRWTREQLKLAFHLYCQLPFGRLHSRNPEIVELARLIGRTPDALAMKLVNFASLDPAITSSGRSGLKGASRLDKEIWDEFHADWEALAVECGDLLSCLQKNGGGGDGNADADTDIFNLDDYTGETRVTLTKQRIKQEFFRRAVLSSYRGRCCMSGLSASRLLVASHIAPWRDDVTNRLNPRNGLCLSAIHDKAFDRGLIALTDNYQVIVSGQLLKQDDKFASQIFLPIKGRQIELPERFMPELELIKLHREKHYVGS